MTLTYLKRATRSPDRDAIEVRETVEAILADIEANGEKAALRYAAEIDRYDGALILSQADIAAAGASLPQQLKDDIQFSADNIRRFAEAQKTTLRDMEMEVVPGFILGQKHIPCEAAGCYAPGGRYAHIASAMMTVTTAKVAGCSHIAFCSPPRDGVGIHPAVTYAADLCGADQMLALGGVQAIAAMAFGLFGLPRADILVGPGNHFVAEAKRILFGRVGIDMLAGPTDSMVIADSTADSNVVAWDLIGQAEHGFNSPVWLATTDRALAERVLEIVPRLIQTLPTLNASSAEAAWSDLAEVIVCSDRDELATLADRIAPEHLSVQASDLDWWLGRLRNFGSLFLGEETTVAFGDKAAGTNHVLPTSGAARYTGGLSVQKFLKTVTWQRATREGARPVAEATARISRFEGMEGHARTADIRLRKWFPGEIVDVE